MKNNYRIFVIAISLLLMCFSFSFSYEKITIVQYPLTANPAIVPIGGKFTIQCKASQSISNWKVGISTPYVRFDNLAVQSNYNNETNLWELIAEVPSNAPFELYDLQVTYDGSMDHVVHAVKVVQHFQKNYYFVHLADLHMPSVAWIGYIDYEDKNSAAEFLQIIDELSIINPEFVLQTGDVIDNGMQEDQFQVVQEIFTTADVPMFVTAGNHDVWLDGHGLWNKYFSPTMDYSFNYGKHHYAGMEMFLLPKPTFKEHQMVWLQNDLRLSANQGNTFNTLFYHFDESFQINADFVDEFAVDLICYGHTHRNQVSTLGARNTLNINTGSTMNDKGEYRLIRVSNNQVQDHPIIKFNNLKINYSPANDGSNWKVRVKIENRNNVDFENGLIKFYLRHDAAGYSITAGDLAQFIETDSVDVYYVYVNISANSNQEVNIISNNPPSNNPPEIINFEPAGNPKIDAGVNYTFSVQGQDQDNDLLNYTWSKDDAIIPNESSNELIYTPPSNFRGLTTITVRVSDNEYYDELTWRVEVQQFSDNPKIRMASYNFFPYNEEMTLEWTEPVPINAYLEFGLLPGDYSNKIHETGENKVIFTPEFSGMEIGLNYCRVTDGNLSSDPFVIIIESPQAPKMTHPIGDVQDLTPIFSWDRVPGVPYYVIVVSDEEILISQDPEGLELIVEGANPTWSMVTSESSVPYGMADPSGTFTNSAPPLLAGESYWWVVLNCYGDSPELVSPVQSGISKFTVDLIPPDMDSPVLLAPAEGDTLVGEIITFEWQPVENASAYHLYPYKIEDQYGIETSTAIWENTIATTENMLEYQAGLLLIEGRYRWKIAAVAENGMEVPSNMWDFYYSTESATISIRTYDNQNTPNNESDDVSLPRVAITYTALSGVYSSFPLSTDLYGRRNDYLISPGTFRFVVEKNGYNTIIDTLTFEEGTQNNLIYRLSLSNSTITGKVVDDLGQAVNGATIFAQHTLHENITKETTTNAQGTFALSMIAGPYQVSAGKTGYQDAAPVSISVESNQVVALASEIILKRNTNFVSGIVKNTSMQPIFGVAVQLTSNSLQFDKVTDADGFFEFVVPDGRWKLHVKKQGFISPADQSISVSGGANIQISPSPVLTPKAGVIPGLVTDGTKSLDNVLIKAFPSAGVPYETTSDVYGQFTFNVQPGTYTLNAEKAGYTFSQFIQITIAGGETKSGQELILSAIQNKIRGKVTTDGYTPVSSAEVFNSNVSMITSDDGVYELGVETGAHVIQAFKEKYVSSQPETVTVAQGQILEQVNFILTPNASVIKGRVSSSGGGINNARIEALNSQTVSANSGENGSYILNLKAGKWLLRGSKSGFFTAEKDTILVGIGQTITSVNFYLAPNLVTLQGTVLHDGLAVRNATILIPSKNLSTTTGSDGVFILSVEQGEYQLIISKSGYRTVYINSSELFSNPTIILEELISQFSGKVIDQNNEPVAEALIKAKSSVDSFQVFSNIEGTYRLDVNPGTYEIIVEKIGYKQSRLSPQQTIGTDEIITLPDIALALNRGNIVGSVLNVQSGQSIPLVRVMAKDISGFSALSQTNDAGLFIFNNEAGDPILLPGTYQLIASKSEFQPATLLGIQVNTDEETTVEIHLQKNTAKFVGNIISEGEPVPDATISAQSIQTEDVFNTISRTDGTFEIKGIITGSYQLRVACSGFTSPEPEIYQTDGTPIQFELIKNIGKIFGVVKDEYTLQPIQGVYVFVDDAFGNNGAASSNAAGNYEITKLPQLNTYTLTARKAGYTSFTGSDLDITQPAQLDIQLNRFRADISGLVYDENSNPLKDVVIQAKSSELSQTDTTDNSGAFLFPDLLSNQYKVTAFKYGYQSNPGEKTISLWQGDDVAGVNFTMREALATQIKIIGPDNVNNRSTQKFNYSAKTADLREASIFPNWQVGFLPGIDAISQDGLLDPRDDFIGLIKLTLKDSITGVSITKNISINQEVIVGNPELNVYDKLGAQLFLKDSCFAKNIILQLRKPQLAGAQRNSRSYEVIGDVYQFLPANIIFLKPAKVYLPIPEGQNYGELLIGKWNSEWLEWESLGTPTMENQTMSAEIGELGRFAMLRSAEPLNMKNLEIKPNPFSPNNGPLKISYNVTSDQTISPQVTIKIYNMVGDFVKTLANRELQNRGKNIVEWDGSTEGGNKALNGRYVIHFQLKDSSGEKEKLKTVVLIK